MKLKVHRQRCFGIKKPSVLIHPKTLLYNWLTSSRRLKIAEMQQTGILRLPFSLAEMPCGNLEKSPFKRSKQTNN